MKHLRYLAVLFRTLMMDAQNLFSDGQAVTATAASTNQYDQGAAQRDGSERYVEIVVTEAFATLASLTIALRSSASSNMGSPAIALQTKAIPVASLTLGARFQIPVPRDTLRYLDLNYTVGGSSATAGKIKAGIVVGYDA
jgi:hypothetical protein